MGDKTIHNLRTAINGLNANEDEINALQDILHEEGFGGREDAAVNPTRALEIARERLAWLRGQREEGLR